MRVKIFFTVLTALSLVALSEEISDAIPEFRYMNFSVDPCEDFYEYTCGRFKDVYPLSNGVSTIDHFTILEEELIKLTSLIFSEPEYKDDPQALNKSKSAYKACLELGYLDEIRHPELTVVKAENGFPLVQMKYVQDNTNYSLLQVADAISNYGIPMLFNIQPYANPGNATSNVIYIYRLETTDLTPAQIRPFREGSYATLIDEAFLTIQDVNVKSDNGTDTLKPFDIFLRKMALKIRNATQSTVTDSEVFENIKAMVTFTRGAFTGGYVDSRIVATIPGADLYSASLKELNDWTKDIFKDALNLDWVEFLQHIFANSGIEITEDTQVMRYTGLEKLLYGILNMVRSSEPHVMKSFVMMRIFTHLALESDGESRQIIEDYFTSMNVDILPRWKYCTRKLIDSIGTATLSFAAAYEYQLRHFNLKRLQEAVQLIQDLQVSFREIINNVAWMDADTKSKAINKFDNMVTILGHPDISYQREELDKFYENLKICKWDNYGNSIRIKAFRLAYQISQVATRERSFWDKSPFEVNAYYNRPNNKMIFPMAMLHPVFFGNNNSILDYGRIGSIIGHEMTHGFDNDGMNYDPNGTMEPWWTEDTKTAFKKRTDCFIEEYNRFYEPEIEEYVNGTTTLNENIADNGGVREAYTALKIMLKRNNILDGSKDFTPEQLFFIGFGTMWCNNPSIGYLKSMNTNAHCRSKFRVNGVVSNMEEFSEAFNCPIGSSMNPSKKCRLW